MEILPLVFAVVLVVLTIVFSVVGIQFILVLMEVRRTLKRVNDTLGKVEERVNLVLQPLQSLGGMASGLGSGLRVFEKFVHWLNREKDE